MIFIFAFIIVLINDRLNYWLDHHGRLVWLPTGLPTGLPARLFWNVLFFSRVIRVDRIGLDWLRLPHPIVTRLVSASEACGRAIDDTTHQIAHPVDGVPENVSNHPVKKADSGRRP